MSERPTYEELMKQINDLRLKIATKHKNGEDTKELEMELLVAEEYLDKTISKGRR